MIRWAVAMALALWAAPAAAVDCRNIAYDDNRYTICEVDVTNDELRLFLKDGAGDVYGHFSAIETELADIGRRPEHQPIPSLLAGESGRHVFLQLFDIIGTHRYVDVLRRDHTTGHPHVPEQVSREHRRFFVGEHFAEGRFDWGQTKPRVSGVEPYP